MYRYRVNDWKGREALPQGGLFMVEHHVQAGDGEELEPPVATYVRQLAENELEACGLERI